MPSSRPLASRAPVLLDGGKEMRDQAGLGDYNGLAQQSAALGAADIKGVTEPGQRRQGHVIFRAGKAIGKPCAVQIERQPVFGRQT